MHNLCVPYCTCAEVTRLYYILFRFKGYRLSSRFKMGKWQGRNGNLVHRQRICSKLSSRVCQTKFIFQRGRINKVLPVQYTDILN